MLDPGGTTDILREVFLGSGFPAWVAAFLLVRLDRTVQALTDRLTELVIEVRAQAAEERWRNK
jgi:hypothetical protein